MIMPFNKKQFDKRQEEGEPNNDYKVILGFAAFIATVLVGSVITVNTGGMGMFSGLNVIGTSVAGHGAFWGGRAAIKKLKQLKKSKEDKPDDKVTEEVDTDHPLPKIQKVNQVAKEKTIRYRYTWENADTHMRSIRKMQTESNYPDYSVQVFVTPTEVKIKHLDQYVSNYRKQVVEQDTNKLVVLTIPTKQFYQETKTSNTPKLQTMKVIREILYQQINKALEEVTK